MAIRTNLKPEDVPQALIDKVVDYLALRAMAEVTRQEVDKVQRAVLAEFAIMGIREHNGSERITDPNRTYLCNNEADLDWYYRVVDARLRLAGLKPDDMDRDYCPALVAEDRQRKAEWAIIDEAAQMLGVLEGKGEFNSALLCAKDGLQKRQEFIDLTVGLVLSL